MATALVTLVQFVVLRYEFCWREKPGEGAGQTTTAVFVVVSVGAPGVCTAAQGIAVRVGYGPPQTIKLPGAGDVVRGLEFGADDGRHTGEINPERRRIEVRQPIAA